MYLLRRFNNEPHVPFLLSLFTTILPYQLFLMEYLKNKRKMSCHFPLNP